MTAQRVKSKLETVEMKQKLANVVKLPAVNNSPKPVAKTNFPLFDNRMNLFAFCCEFLILFWMCFDFFSLPATPTLERQFEDPIVIATDGIYMLLIWPAVLGRDVYVSVVGEFLQFRVTLSALRYSRFYSGVMHYFCYVYSLFPKFLVIHEILARM